MYSKAIGPIASSGLPVIGQEQSLEGDGEIYHGVRITFPLDPGTKAMKSEIL